ncbi:sensor histidine kinase [Vallitalea okinawensis]|uniref:sensor histidine kinase n=1 Tax=Vallitalea okinawensis TaxID=2078660 RepID=UPI00147836B6|nr:HAMP domain-containing sensor histidine kinase [Vallitalea okinawensis]
MKYIDVSNQSEDTDLTQVMLDSFLHELKNPLSVLNGNIKLLELTDPELMSSMKWTSLKNNINHLCNLVNDFSTINKTMDIKFETFDILSVLKEVSSMFYTTAKEKGIYINTQFNTDNQLLISGDSNKIKQAVINLIKNSVEACENCDQITLRAELQDDHLDIIVNDTGLGMSQYEMKHITTPYVSFKDYGTGLGLALVKWVVNQHHGELLVASEKNCGSTFIMRLPVLKTV